MTNRKGTRFEKDTLDHLREKRFDVERLRLTGTEDEGDLLLRLHGGYRLVLELKNVARMDLAGWVAEAEVERENYIAHRGGFLDVGFAVVHKRKGKGPHASYVTLPLYEYLEQISR